MQVFPKQHPEAQVLGPQEMGAHVPFVQLARLEQSWQAPPPLPQAESLVPCMQVLPAQQPEHVPGPQGAAVHEPLVQVAEPVHALHAAPPLPQALVAIPA